MADAGPYKKMEKHRKALISTEKHFPHFPDGGQIIGRHRAASHWGPITIPLGIGYYAAHRMELLGENSYTSLHRFHNHQHRFENHRLSDSTVDCTCMYVTSMDHMMLHVCTPDATHLFG